MRLTFALTWVLRNPYIDFMSPSFLFKYFCGLLLCCLLGGCSATAPIHLWRPPMLASTVGGKVVVSELVGEGDLVEKVHRKLFDLAPYDSGRQVMLVDYQTLRAESDVQLVSAIDDEVNDLALASLARRAGASFVLRGEVFERRTGDYQKAMDDQLTISWRLTALDGEREGGGMPVSVTMASAIERYPDLALLGNSDEVLSTAAVRDTYRLMMPTVGLEEIELESAYVLPGSSQLRRANALAQAGSWSEAEEIWKAVRRKSPFQIAAIHNLALAAVARQDFSEAKNLASRAVRLHPSQLHQRTLAWVETRQRAYHASFGLPDPPEGWFLTRD